MLDTIYQLLIEQRTILIIVLVAVILDFVTGITKAIFQKNIQSEKLRNAIPKMMGYFAIIIIGVCLQIVFKIDFVTKIICLFIIVIEFISVIENVNNYVTIPKFLTKLLDDKKNELDKGGNDIE